MIPNPVSRPRTTLAAWAVMCAIAVLGIVNPWDGPRLGLDPSVSALLPSDDPELSYYRDVRRAFGTEDVLVVGLEADDVFTTDRLTRLDRLTHELGALRGVSRAEALVTVPEPKVLDDRVAVAPLVEAIPTDTAQLAELRARVLAHPLYGHLLIAPGGRGTAIVLRLADLSDADFLESGLESRVGASIARHWNGAGESGWVSGMPVLKAATSRAMAHDLARLLPASFFVAVVIFVVVFRSARAVGLLAGMVAVTLLGTFGAMGWARHAVNLTTSSVPILVIAVGCSYLMHVLFALEEVERVAPDPRDRAAAVAAALERVARPNLGAALTTVAGLLSLLPYRIDAIREFGLFAAIGTFIAHLVCTGPIPAVLRLMPPVRRAPRSGATFDRFAERLGRFDLRWRTLLIATHAVVLVIGLVGATRMRVDLDFVGNFSAASPVRQHLEKLGRWFGGASTFVVVVEGDRDGAFKEPANLAALRGLQLWLEGLPEVGSAISPVTLGMQLYRLERRVGSARDDVRPTPEVIDRLLSLVGFAQLSPYVTRDFRRTAIIVHADVKTSAEIGALRHRVEQRLATIRAPLKARVTGDAVLISSTIDAIARGQAFSLGLDLVAMVALMSWVLGGLRAGLLALIPNVLPIVFLFGLMGIFGITLNSSTALLANVLLGIVVDDTIHFVWHFRRARAELDDPRAAIGATLRAVGRPVLWTAVVLASVFLMLSASSLAQLGQFGGLGAVTLVFACLADLTLTPVLAMAGTTSSGGPATRR